MLHIQIGWWKLQPLYHYYTFWRKYTYRRLPIELNYSLEISQEVMENVLREIVECDICINVIECFSSSSKHHLDLLDIVLYWLRVNDFTVNPLKCEQTVQEKDWLGYWLTPRGLKPWKNQGCLANGHTPRCNHVTRLHWNSKLLQRHMAKQSTCSQISNRPFRHKKETNITIDTINE